MRTIYQPTGRALEYSPRKRAMSSHGYVLVYAPIHPNAFSNGYYYEHRMVAEVKLGRLLSRDELVHHRNEIKTDNRPENIEVVPSVAAHKVLHRRKGASLRLPGEANPVVACGCGCGRTMPKFDTCGRPRRLHRGCSWRKGIKGSHAARQARINAAGGAT